MFAQRLRAALTSRGRTVWLDTADIVPTSVWRRDIIEAIEAASAVIFVLSPEWLAAELCQRELQYALQMHKKLVPVVYRHIDHRLVNPGLASFNWIFARENDSAAMALHSIL